MKKFAIIAGTLLIGLCAQEAQAQFAVSDKKKKKYQETEQQEDRPEEFVVSGFARDKDYRLVKKRDKNNDALNGFDNKEYLSRDIETEEPKKTKRTKKSKGQANSAVTTKPKPNRDRDIESLMGDLVLGRIQKPVVRGVFTEHLRDVDGVMAKEGLNNADKNVMLKQLYALRNKRLSEVLNDTQYRTWLKEKDQDMYLDIEVPEDY